MVVAALTAQQGAASIQAFESVQAGKGNLHSGSSADGHASQVVQAYCMQEL